MGAGAGPRAPAPHGASPTTFMALLPGHGGAFWPLLPKPTLTELMFHLPLGLCSWVAGPALREGYVPLWLLLWVPQRFAGDFNVICQPRQSSPQLLAAGPLWPYNERTASTSVAVFVPLCGGGGGAELFPGTGGREGGWLTEI